MMSSQGAGVVAGAVVGVSLLLAGCSGGQSPSASSDETSPAPGKSSSSRPTGEGAPRQSSSGSAKPTGKPAPGAPTAGSSYDDSSGTDVRRPASQTKVLKGLPGAASTKCVDVGARPDVRSGSFAMGNFKEARALFKANKGSYDAPESFFYVIPRAARLKRVALTLTPVQSSGRSVALSLDQVEEAAQWRYFAVHVKIPRPGRWRLTVAAPGQQRGCFVVRFDV